MSEKPRERVIVGITGASGAVYGLRCLDLLREAGVETHLVVSRAGELTLRHEAGLGLADMKARCDHLHRIGNVGASIASGSFRVRGMIVAPCSIRTLSEIASGITSSLLTRAADVMLKERRPLVLMVRESPLHLGHIRSMAAAAEIGAIIAPPMPAFYTAPRSIEDLVDHSVSRSLGLLGLDDIAVKSWTGLGDRAGD